MSAQTATIQMPTIKSYGDYSSDNYGAHTLQVTIGTLTLFFSYKTVVAFENRGGLVCSENCWAQTTGKHLNWIEPNKRARVKRPEFERLLAETMADHGLQGVAR